MDNTGQFRPFIMWATVLVLLAVNGRGAEIYHEWNVSLGDIRPVNIWQPVITINGMFPGPLINATTNDNVHINIFNNLDEPLLMTWNGIQQRLNSWQDGVSGTNCPIEPGKNWTAVFQVKDQIGSFFYFPSTHFQKAAGGYGPIRVNNREVIPVPFGKPEDEFDLLIGDWYGMSYKEERAYGGTRFGLEQPSYILMNGKATFVQGYETFNVSEGKTYRLRISSVCTVFSINFRIQGHQMVLVETEGSYTQQITLHSLDIHVGQSYSVLVTANQNIGDYYMVATPTQVNTSSSPEIMGLGLFHYDGSTTPPSDPIPSGPNQLDRNFSVNQAKSIRWNMTTGAARPNPQGTFNVSNVAINQTFILRNSRALLDDAVYYTVNNESYLTPDTPLKLADYLANGSGVYQVDAFPKDSVNEVAAFLTSVVSGIYKGWAEIIFQNDLTAMDPGHLNQYAMDAWHLDGFGFYVVGFGDGDWNPASRESYNLLDPVVRSTVQVYPGGWSAVYVYLDNPGMWNLRSQCLTNWYWGEELYIRVFNADPNPAKERPPPGNLLLCGKFALVAPSPAPSPQTSWW